jgi:hypothetical protein
MQEFFNYNTLMLHSWSKLTGMYVMAGKQNVHKGNPYNNQ